MIKQLTIKNYALIRHLEIYPAATLSTITGETGAGKSIMLGALGLLLGNRADTKVLFDDGEKCLVEAVFDISAYNLSSFFLDNQLEQENECILRREIAPNGKSRAFINDTPISLDILKQIGNKLLDIHSQHDTLLLSESDFQLGLVDAYAQTQLEQANYLEAYGNYKAALSELNAIEAAANQMTKEAEYDRFVYEELSRAQLKIGEQAAIEHVLNILENTEDIKLRLSQCVNLLTAHEFAINTQLHHCIVHFEKLNLYSSDYNKIKERAQASLIELKDIALDLEDKLENTEYDPERTVQLRERLDLLYALQKKYKTDSIDSLLQWQVQLAAKLERVMNFENEINVAKAKLDNTSELLETQAIQLSQKRRAVFETIEFELKELLVDLSIPNAAIQIKHARKQFELNGIDQISILFSANKGILPQELKNVASGGEFSRLMMCIKYILADKTSLPTIIFDEIDTGVSGEVAIKMATMMKKMALKHQVITITHLPQIAASGLNHFYVYKDDTGERTLSSIRQLSTEERVAELAEMMGGKNPSLATLAIAQELLDKAKY